MNVTQSFKLALKSLRTSKMRAFLTMLGIVIGVGAVIIIISLGNGLTGMVEQQVDKVGINQIYAYNWGRGDGTTMNLDAQQMYDLIDGHPDVFSGVTPWVSGGTGVRQGSLEFEKTKIYGVSEAMYRADTGTTLDGDALGKTLTIGGVPYTVVGVMAQELEELREGGSDDVVYIPYENAMEMSGSRTVTLYQVMAVSRDTVAEGKALLQNMLWTFYQDEDAYYIETMLDQVNMINAMMGVAMLVLVAIAAISLLVGGIGIMNIMLVSVTERTREIGIRKSLGARRRDIRRQFIIEAGTTSAMGGIIGILFGCLVATGIGSVLGGMLVAQLGTSGITFNATPSLGAILISFGVSVGIGVLFGYLPANKAAKLNPIDALRYE